jgi:hypothetical protein
MDADRDARGRFISAAHKHGHWWASGLVVAVVLILIAIYAW